MTNYIRKIGKKARDGTLIDSLQIKVFSKIYFSLNSDIRNTVFLAGTGRSGTTWLSNIINYKNEFRYMFEPFYNQKVDICSHFSFRQYLRPENKEERFLFPATKILSGKIKNQWIDRFNKKFLSSKRLVKDIRANLFLKWMKNNFPEVKLIFMMRHPGPVVLSRISQNWKTDLTTFLNQPDLIEDYLSDFVPEMNKTSSEFERGLFLWAIENFVALKQLRD